MSLLLSRKTSELTYTSHSSHKTKLQYKQLIALLLFFGIYIKNPKPMQTPELKI